LLTLKNILKRYTTWIAKVLAPLGPWGVFAIAAVDGSLFGMPVDAVVAGYIYYDRSHFLLYVLLASAGSATGSLVLYGIGYFGGETLLRKRMSRERFAKIHASFERHEFWALMFPAMLPPPTPFKMFVLAASAFEMRLTHFLAAVFAGRFVRFLVLALLTIKFGPKFVQFVTDSMQQRSHWLWPVAILALITVLILYWKKRKQATPRDPGVANRIDPDN
jgi:membrane protein YqaA with SNARE-associated domain